MKKQFKVFSNHALTAQVEATLEDGSKVQATVACTEVQLVPVGCNSGTIKLSYTNPDDQAAAAATFTEGALVDVDFTLAADQGA